MLTEADIQRIADRVVAGYGPIAVGTFGSYAVGTPKPKSDLDLFIIHRTTHEAGSRRRAVARLLFGVLHPLDIHVFTPEEFEETVTEELSFTWIIARQARLYHWTREADRLLPSLREWTRTPPADLDVDETVQNLACVAERNMKPA